MSVVGPDSAESPVPGAVLLALPFDRDSLLTALESKAATPRPHVTELDSLFAKGRAPFNALTTASVHVAALRDSLGSAGADQTRLQRELSLAEIELAGARRGIDSVRRAIGPRLDTLRADVSRWENSTYAPYESLARVRLKASGRADVQADTTGPDGWAHLHLPAGRWWISSTSWDISDPNRFWYWNLPIASDTVMLDSRHGSTRRRY